MDVECDFGYFKANASTCLPLPADRLPQCPALQHEDYVVSTTGQRLLHGDVCTGNRMRCRGYDLQPLNQAGDVIDDGLSPVRYGMTPTPAPFPLCLLC